MEYFLNTYMERSRESVSFLQSREHCRLQPTNGAENILIGETAVSVCGRQHQAALPAELGSFPFSVPDVFEKLDWGEGQRG